MTDVHCVSQVEMFGDGEMISLRAPNLALRDLSGAPLPADMRRSYRIAPAMIGLGLLEAVDDATLESFRVNLYHDDFVFSVTRDFVRRCRTPFLVMPGNDAPHPTAIGLEVAELAPNAELLMDWKNKQTETLPVIRRFLEAHTP